MISKLEFDKLKFRKALRKMEKDRVKLKHEWQVFAAANGFARAKYRHLRHMINIFQLLNRKRVRSVELIKFSKWIRKYKLGKFALTEDLLLPKIVLGNTIHNVEFLYNYHALPYIKFIEKITGMSPMFVRHMIAMEQKP